MDKIEIPIKIVTAIKNILFLEYNNMTVNNVHLKQVLAFWMEVAQTVVQYSNIILLINALIDNCNAKNVSKGHKLNVML